MRIQSDLQSCTIPIETSCSQAKDSFTFPNISTCRVLKKKIRKSTNRLKKSWIVSMMWRMLQEQANGSATRKPYNWSYPRHMKKKPNKTRLRNNIKLSKVITMCTPGRKRYQNGPMIYVHSRALQLASCSFLQAPVQCAHQVRNDTKMDQWSTFVPRTSVDLMQFFWKMVITEPETIPKWTNNLRLISRTSRASA